MAIVPLPLLPDAEARALLHHLLEHGHIAGRGSAGGTIIQLEVDDWVLESLMPFTRPPFSASMTGYVVVRKRSPLTTTSDRRKKTTTSPSV